MKVATIVALGNKSVMHLRVGRDFTDSSSNSPLNFSLPLETGQKVVTFPFLWPLAKCDSMTTVNT